MATFVIDEDQITHVPGATAFTLSEADSIWIFQENVQVLADNLGGGTAIGGGGFDGSLLQIEGKVDGSSYLLGNFGSNVEIIVAATGRMGMDLAGLINLSDGKNNHFTNYGIVHAAQFLIGENGVVSNHGTMAIAGANMTGYGPTGAELFSNDGTFQGGVTNFRTIVNDGQLSGGIVGASVGTTVINTGTIGYGISFKDGDDSYDGTGDGVVNGAVDGGRGDDTLDGGRLADTFQGDQGEDLLIGKAGDDSLAGGAGDDEITGGSGNDTLDGNAGADKISGGSGDDVIDGGAGNDSINGNGGDDVIVGGDGEDWLVGSAGDDSIRGGDGADRLDGEFGEDTLFGGDGDDKILGGTDDDTLYGGAGNDTLIGEQGIDVLFGGDGEDLYVFRVGSDVDFVMGFKNDVDKISLATFDFQSVDQALSFAQEGGGGVTFNFQTGDVLFVQNATIASLADDILI